MAPIPAVGGSAPAKPDIIITAPTTWPVRVTRRLTDRSKSIYVTVSKSAVVEVNGTRVP